MYNNMYILIYTYLYIKEKEKVDYREEKGWYKEGGREREREPAVIATLLLGITATCADYYMYMHLQFCSPSGEAYCIHLIDVDNAGSMFASLLEEIPHSGWTNTCELLL